MSTKNTDPACPKCHKHQFAVEATYRKRLPLGFGFGDNSSRFRVDVIEIHGYKGFCLECDYEGEVEISRKRKTIYPKNINRKLAQARG